jgi:hypothetical protein
MRTDVGEKERALPFLGSYLADCQQAAETAICRAVARVSEKARRVLKVEPRADDEFDSAYLLGGEMSAYHAGKRVAIGDGDRRKLERSCRGHQLFGMGGPAQEGEIGGDVEFGIAGHGKCPQPKTPCMNQPGLPRALS